MSLRVPEWLANHRDPTTRAVLALARQISNAGGVAMRAMIRDAHGNPIAPPLPQLLKRAHPTGARRKAIDRVGARKGWWEGGKKRRRVRLYYRRQQGLDRDLLALVGLTACRDHLTGEIRDPHWRQTGERYLSARRLAELTGLPVSRRVRPCAAEQRLWQPHWSKNDPLDKRLRRVGMADATVDMVVCLMSGWEAFNRGEPFSAATNALLDQHEQSVASADRQLATILEQRAAPDF